MLESAHQQRYAELIAELAEIFSVDATVLKEFGHLIVNGVHVGLVDFGSADLGWITVLFDLGPIPDTQSHAVYRQLLEQNVRLPSSFGVFAIIPDNGHGALVYRFDLAGNVNGRTLARHIHEVSAAYAKLENIFEEVARNRQTDSQQRLLRERLSKRPTGR